MRQQGNAIILTMIVLTGVVTMMLASTAQMRSSYMLNDMHTARQQAAQAAEAVAAMREARLVDIAASNDLSRLTVNPDTGRSDWLGMPYDEDDPWEGVDWFGNCIVQWRVEPVRVGNDAGDWTSNPTLSGFGTPTDAAWVENNDLYHYRIVSQAHYLTDNQALDGTDLAAMDAAGELPWQDAGSAVVSIQAQRIVQMRLNSLFKYALFYAAEGRDGDIEVHNGPAQAIMGKAHSNGAVFMGGSEKVKQSSSNPRNFWGNYGEGNTGRFDVGSASQPASLTGIDGVFSLRKVQLYQGRRDDRMAGITYIPPSDPEYGDDVWFGDGSADPLPTNSKFPVPVTSSWQGGRDMNYFGANKRINDVSLRPWADSRSPGAMVARHGAFVRDGVNSGAQVVKTLSNIPELGGRPFEAQRLFEAGTQIWTTNPGDPMDWAYWTVLPNDPPEPYYDFGGVTTPDADDIVGFKSTGPGAHRVTTFARPLYLSVDPTGLQAYLSNASYDRPASPSADDASLLSRVDIPHPDQVANPGMLRLGAPINPRWFVDAGGLRQFYQRITPGVGSYRVNGDNTSEAALNIIDIFDPDPRYDGHPDAPATTTRNPGDAGYRYNGPPSPAGDGDGDTFADNAVPGLYLTFAREGGDQPETAGKFGLIIRERRYQVVPNAADPTAWTNMPNRPPWPMPGGYAGGSSQWVQDHLNYLRSQYLVYFGEHEITDLFLAFQAAEAAASEDDSDLIVYERDIVEDRKMATMEYTFWAADSNIGGSAYRRHPVNLLTLNLRKVLDFIETTPASTVSPSLGGSVLGDTFHGMIYAHRTRRSEGYTPWFRTRWQRDANLLWYQTDSINWEPPPGTSDGSGEAWLQDPQGEIPNHPNTGFDWRVGSGPSFVFHSGIRIADAQDIDYGQYYDDGVYQTKRGLTIISPNPVYAWGHCNVTKYADSEASAPLGARAEFKTGSADDGELLDQKLDWDYSGTEFHHGDPAWEHFKMPPMAIFTDNLCMLSTAWRDEVQAPDSETGADDTCMFFSVIMGNAPTRIDGNGYILASGGQHNVMRYLENWSSQYHHTLGSVVCLSPARYSFGVMGLGDPGSTGWRFYNPPRRDFNMNTDLFTKPGQPPFTPFGIKVVRTVSTLQEYR